MIKYIGKKELDSIIKNYVWDFPSLRFKKRKHIIFFLSKKFFCFTIENSKVLGISYGIYETFGDDTISGYKWHYKYIDSSYQKHIMSTFNNSDTINKEYVMNSIKILFSGKKPLALFPTVELNTKLELDNIDVNLNTDFKDFFYLKRACAFIKKKIFIEYLKNIIKY